MTVRLFPRLRQRGAFAVEAAIAFPVLIGVGLIGADMHRIHTERIRVENAAGVLAVNIAAQPLLTVAGVDALAASALQGHEGMQQLWVLHVRASGRINWVLQRAGATGLCQPPAAGGIYGADLPEPKPEADENGDVSDDRLAMVVVLACRDTSDIAFSGGLVLPAVLQSTAVFRSSSQTITLDAPLKAESDANGMAYIDKS